MKFNDTYEIEVFLVNDGQPAIAKFKERNYKE